MDCIGYGAHNDKGLLVPIEFKRRIAGPDDVTFRITHCGVCFAEVEWVFNRKGYTKYPIVPGYVCSKVCILFHYIFQFFGFWKLHLKFCSSRAMFLSCASMLPEFF
jgi:hypothetical protein